MSPFPSMAFCTCSVSSSAVRSGSMSVIGASVAEMRVDTDWYTGVAGRTAALVNCSRMIAYCGYFCWKAGSSYSEVRTAGRPPSIEV